MNKFKTKGFILTPTDKTLTDKFPWSDSLSFVRHSDFVSYKKRSLCNCYVFSCVVIQSFQFVSVLCSMFHALRPKAGTSLTTEGLFIFGQRTFCM